MKTPRDGRRLSDFYQSEFDHEDSSGKNSYAILAMRCLLASVPAQDLSDARLERSILIVEVPSARWIADIVSACGTLFTNHEVVTFEAEDRIRPVEIRQLLRRHVLGVGMVIVCEDHQTIPEQLLRSAARHYRLEGPDLQSFLSVAKDVLEGDVDTAFEGINIKNFDFDTLCLCLVAGDSAGNAAEKLRHAGKRVHPQENLPRLADVHGYGEAADWAKDLVLDLMSYKAGQLHWSEVDHGVLMYGPPGTGKSLFARIVANEAGIPIIQASIADYFATGSGNLDGVIRKQRELFAKASAAAPCLLFIDELDALPSRDNSSRSSDFWRPVVTDFLLLLDSAMADRDGVILMGATNRLWDLDPALIRAGRMDRILYVPAPDAHGLAGILRHYLGDELSGEDLLPLTLARPNSTGADAVNWVKSARRRARTRGRNLQMEDLATAIIGVETRPEKARLQSAVHEIGHALAALVMQLDVNAVTIAQTDGTNGHVSVSFGEDGLVTKRQLEASVIVLLAGRAAESVLLPGEISTGAGGSATSDLAFATARVHAMHTKFAMGDRLTYQDGPADGHLSAIIETDLKRLYGIATDLIVEHLDLAWAMVRELLSARTLSGERLKRLYALSLDQSATAR